MSSEHVSHVASYRKTFGALLVLTVLTVAVAFVDLGALNDIVALGIASLKASLVLLFFMHVRENSAYTILVMASGVLFFLCLVAFTLSDVFTRDMMGLIRLI